MNVYVVNILATRNMIFLKKISWKTKNIIFGFRVSITRKKIVIETQANFVGLAC